MKKIAYVTTYDPYDRNAWSGSGYNILKTLKESGLKVGVIGNLDDKFPILFKIKKFIYSIILAKNYLRDREPLNLKNYAKQVEQSLKSKDFDIIFSPGTVPIAYLKTDKPIVFWTDATFAGMIDFYSSFSDLDSETKRHGNEMEQLALSRCSLAIYTSQWAADTAIQNYKVNPKKVKIVPFGANIDVDRNVRDIGLYLINKSFNVCKLLFIGMEWERKGGDIALKVAELLNKRGLKTELHIVGIYPKRGMPNFVKRHGYISKNSKKGRDQLDQLYSESHFLILPTMADCVPVVLAEASSFGLPSLTTNVGGIPSTILDGRNGQTFNLKDTPEKYCDYIEKLMSSPKEYNDLALTSFKEYTERLNWNSAGKEIFKLLNTLNNS